MIEGEVAICEQVLSAEVIAFSRLLSFLGYLKIRLLDALITCNIRNMSRW